MANQDYVGTGRVQYSSLGDQVGRIVGEAKCEQPPHLEAIIAKLERCFESADEASKRANAVADRVVGGGQLPDPSVGSKMANIGGDIARIYDMLDGLSLRIRDAIAEISRLERL